MHLYGELYRKHKAQENECSNTNDDGVVLASERDNKGNLHCNYIYISCEASWCGSNMMHFESIS